LLSLEQWAGYLSGSGMTQVEVHGHADEVGSEQYNMELSANQARQAALKLQELVPETLLIKEFAHGEMKPLTAGKEEASRSQNRRVEITVPEIKDRNAAAPISFGSKTSRQ